MVAWRTRADFLRALELAVEQPVASEWFGLADPDWTLELGEHVDGDVGVPPAEGALELTSAGDDTADLVAAPNQATRWSELIELDGRVWKEGAWGTRQPSLVRLEVRGHPAPATPPWTTGMRIEHAYDAPGLRTTA